MSEQSQSEAARLAGEIVVCRDCHIPYCDLGVDLVLPDQQWKAFLPEGGILCANCICKRAAKLGATCIMAWLDNLDHSQSFGDEIVTALEGFTEEVEQVEPPKPMIPKPGDRVRIVEAEKMGPAKEFPSGPIYDHKLVAGQAQTVYSVHGKHNEKFAGCFSVSETSVWFPPEYIAEILPAEPQEDDSTEPPKPASDCPEVETIELSLMFDDCSFSGDYWKELSQASRDEAWRFAQHFQSRGFELGRAAAEGDVKYAENQNKKTNQYISEFYASTGFRSLNGASSAIAEFRKTLEFRRKKIETLTAELAAAKEEIPSLQARLADTNNGHKWYRKYNEVKAELKAAKEEVEQHKFYKEQYLHLFETLNKSIGKQTPIQSVPGPLEADKDYVLKWLHQFGQNFPDKIPENIRELCEKIFTPPQQEPELPVVGWWQEPNGGPVHTEHCEELFRERLAGKWSRAAWNDGEVPEWVEAARAAGEGV